MKLSYLLLPSTDPAYNLAVEEILFRCAPHDRMYVMLWQNDNAIIIGKHQNTLAEINADFVAARGIRVVRRLSGGCAVYHDMGNLNYTIIAPSEEGSLDFGRFGQIVVRALGKLGVSAEMNGRNDLTIDGRKFSGCAQYVRDGRVMHHGTLLFDSDLETVSQALQTDPRKLAAKGVKSVRSRVTNIRAHLKEDMPLPQFRDFLLRCILEEFPGEPFLCSEAFDRKAQALKQSRYDTWDWNYGRSPAATWRSSQRFEGVGTVEACAGIQNGVVESIVFRGDFFAVGDVAALCQVLTGVRADRESFAAALTAIDAGRYIHGLTNDMLLSLLTGADG